MSPTSTSDAQAAAALAPALYLVATPIGNLGDLSVRAGDVLAAVDLIACEDTRVTVKLLSHLGLKKPLLAYHDHNAARVQPKIMEALEDGGTVALVSDAGTPLVSDPGYKLVRAVLEAGHRVSALPGPSSVLTALCLSGLPPDRFFSGGFLPSKTKARRQALEAVKAVPGTLIFLESVKRLDGSLSDMADILGKRPAAVCREMTKLFEEVRRGSLSDLAAYYRQEGPPKGEAVIVIGPPPPNAALSAEDVDRRLRDLLIDASVKDAAQQLSAETGIARKVLYARALDLKDAP